MKCPLYIGKGVKMANYPYYGGYYNPGFTPAQPAQQNPGIIWVSGEAGAKAYLVGAGQSVLLMDSENACFYIKTTDASGMPMPLRVFDYKERTAQAPAVKTPEMDMSDYVTREEFQKWADDFRDSIKGEKDGK